MWIVLGCAAIIATVLNIVWMIRRRDARWFRFAGLSLTALTLCAEHMMIGNWVRMEDWAALADVVPGVSRALWVLVLVSIVVNGISLLQGGRRDER